MSKNDRDAAKWTRSVASRKAAQKQKRKAKAAESRYTGEYDELSVPVALRLMSNRYIRKPDCKLLLIIAAKIVEDETWQGAKFKYFVKKYTEEMRDGN